MQSTVIRQGAAGQTPLADDWLSQPDGRFRRPDGRVRERTGIPPGTMAAKDGQRGLVAGLSRVVRASPPGLFRVAPGPSPREVFPFGEIAPDTGEKQGCNLPKHSVTSIYLPNNVTAVT